MNDDKRRARRGRMARADERQGLARPDDALDEELDPAAARLAPGEARLDHASIVQDQRVAPVHQGGQVRHPEIFNRPAGGQMKQAAGAALGRRVLRDELGRQVVVELGDEHPAQL